MHYSKVIIAISLALIISLIVYIVDDANVVDKEVGVPSLVQRGLLHLRGLKKKKKRGKANKSGKNKRGKADKAGKNDNVFVKDSKDYEVNNVSNPTTPTPTPAPPIPSDNLVPVAHPDSVTLPAEGFVSVDVLENDKAADEHELFVNATASNNDDCSVGLDRTTVMVHPQGNADGSCEYEVCDEQNMCSKATITFTVEDVDNNNNKESAPTNWSEDEYDEVEAIDSGVSAINPFCKEGGRWCDIKDCASGENRRFDPENECPKYLSYSDNGIRSASCCGSSPNGGCLVRRLKVSGWGPSFEAGLGCGGGETACVPFLDGAVAVYSSDRLEFQDSWFCGFMDRGSFCGQDCAGDSNILSGIELATGRCLGALNELQLCGNLGKGCPINGRIGCNPSTGLGTWSEDRVVSGRRWTGKQIGRARSPKYCEEFALRQPVYISDFGKMYDGNRWFCWDEGCWPSGMRCGRDGGWGQSDLGCFRDHVSEGGKRYWGGCCSGEIEYHSGTYSYWYQCK